MTAIRTLVVSTCVWLAPLSAAYANGRMPGANDLAFHEALPERIVARATFGIVQSQDYGSSFRWICEQALDISGTIEDPPIALTQDGSMVLLPPTLSALVSHDQGCSWQRAEGPLSGRRGVDLTLDPSTGERLLVLTSTLRTVDERGSGSYENALFETRDNGRSWQQLAALPDDMEAETVEVAKSDAKRIYVSGIDRANARLGVLLVSDDGGQIFTRRTLELPSGTGSFLISAIHPLDPQRVWLRVPARGDAIGLLATRLFITRDGGQSFAQIAATNKGMFGFALSPDGSQLAYGGPNDGFHIGPSDGGAFVKKSSLSIRCLRWPQTDKLYACADEPTNPFTIGVSSDQGTSFQSVYKIADTCPAECAAGSSFDNSCRAVWTQQIRERLTAPAAMCQAWAQPHSSADGAIQDAGGRDAGVSADDASLDAGSERSERDQGCACGITRPTARASWWHGLSLAAVLALTHRRAKGRAKQA